ncbi:MAG: YraN family protein [Candidatus Manganitrophaceae bacterium]|nr:MAG: YraN family protein [Candidatus Manganitrophaceae bacterium]
MTGAEGEKIAAEFLSKRGYRILERNFRTALGEIDLIAQDGKVLVFVEVKARSGNRFGVPQGAVDLRKQAKMNRVALLYLSQKKREDCQCRFDVIGITQSSNGAAAVEHFKNAFEGQETGTGC